MTLLHEVDAYLSKLRLKRQSIINDASKKTLGTLKASDILLGLRGTPALHWEHSRVTENGPVLTDGRNLAELGDISVERLLLFFLTGQMSGDLRSYNTS